MFQATDAALIRAAAYPRDLILPAWPDLAAGRPEEWLEWLRRAWALPGFAAAVVSATSQLADQIDRALAHEPVAERRLRRLVEATIRYLLRWTTRATPFGTFAGVAPVELGTWAAVRWGEEHQAVARPDGEFVVEHTALAEQDLATLRTVPVVANTLGYARGGRWVLPCARTDGERVWDVEIDLTTPVRSAVEAARSPIMFGELAAVLAEELPIDQPKAEKLLADLVGLGVLLSAVRPPMTVTDPTSHLARHINLSDSSGRTTTDLRIDCSVTLPPAVIHEAKEAVSTLVALSSRLPGWDAYHRAFIERWGPGTAVPLQDVLNVLGFPAGYRGSFHRREPATLTARDSLLLSLAQQSVLDGCYELVLDDDLIGRLHGDDDRLPIPHTELRFALAARTSRDLERGTFTLTVVSGARHAGVSAGRFLHLLTKSELELFHRTYTNLPTAMPDAVSVQVSGPPLEPRLASLARVPELLPVLPVGDYHPAPLWTLEDLAVAGDGRRLWLVSLRTGQPVEPLLFNCVLLPTVQQPLIRFLAEIWMAWTAPCSPFDWGPAARGLPFLPRIRRGRSILHPARWIIPATALPGRIATWHQWRTAWEQHRDRYRLPREVMIGDDDIRLRLDLEESAHLAVLRRHLDHRGPAVLTEAPGPAGWIDGRPHELLLTFTRTPPHREILPRPVRPANTLQYQPGLSDWLESRLHGQCDDILARLTELDDRLDSSSRGWWFIRYHEPEPHLRLRIPLPEAARSADAARYLALWAEQLHNDGLLRDYALTTYRPETRHGTGRTLAAAEAVFAADSRAALQRLSGDRQATTAAGVIAIAEGFTGDGLRWLVDHVPHLGGEPLDQDQLNHVRCAPWKDEGLLTALADYRTLAEQDGLDVNLVLADLLHLHHARMIGVDTASERHCMRLARAAAQAKIARGAS